MSTAAVLGSRNVINLLLRGGGGKFFLPAEFEFGLRGGGGKFFLPAEFEFGLRGGGAVIHVKKQS